MTVKAVLKGHHSLTSSVIFTCNDTLERLSFMQNLHIILITSNMLLYIRGPTQKKNETVPVTLSI